MTLMVAWIIWPLKLSPKWPLMCRLGTLNPILYHCYCFICYPHSIFNFVVLLPLLRWKINAFNIMTFAKSPFFCSDHTTFSLYYNYVKWIWWPWPGSFTFCKTQFYVVTCNLLTKYELTDTCCSWQFSTEQTDGRVLNTWRGLHSRVHNNKLFAGWECGAEAKADAIDVQ